MVESDTENSVGAAGIRSKLVELHDKLLGVQVEPDSPDVEAAYRLFVDTWQRGRATLHGHFDDCVPDDHFYFEGILDDIIVERAVNDHGHRYTSFDWGPRPRLPRRCRPGRPPSHRAGLGDRAGGHDDGLSLPVPVRNGGMRRRTLLKGLLATAVAAPGFRLPLVDASSHAGKLFVFVQADGGLGTPPASATPRPTPAASRSSTTGRSATTCARSGNILYAPFANNAAFFEKYYRRMLVINGVDAQTNSHTVGVVHNWSGRNSEGLPDPERPARGPLRSGPAHPLPELRRLLRHLRHHPLHPHRQRRAAAARSPTRLRTPTASAPRTGRRSRPNGRPPPSGWRRAPNLMPADERHLE